MKQKLIEIIHLFPGYEIFKKETLEEKSEEQLIDLIMEAVKGVQRRSTAAQNQISSVREVYSGKFGY